MKIALVTYSTKPRGGVVHTLSLAEALVGLGVEVDVWALGRGGDRTFFRRVDSRVCVRVVPYLGVEGEAFGERVLRSIMILRGAFESDGYDIVHAQDCISANAVGSCVRTVHHIDQFSTPELAACHERAIVEPWAHVCVSRAVAGELAEGWGISARVIPNGVEAERFAAAASDDPDAVAARGRWQERLGAYILAVGGIEPRKGSMDLLESYARFAEERGSSGVRLVVAGGDTLFDYRGYRAEWEIRAKELGVEPLVLGPVGHEELPALVAGAAVFAFPSVKEGFGLAAMEALAAGVPVVTRDLPVFREVFGDSALFADDISGFAERYRDAIEQPDPDRAAAGRELAFRHTWKAAAQAHLDLYRELRTSR